MNTFKVTKNIGDAFIINADFYLKKEGWIKFYKYGDEYDYFISTMPPISEKRKKEIMTHDLNENHVLSIETIDENKL